MAPGYALGTLKQLLLGRPIPSSLGHRERFSRTTGLAVLSSDALSSVAYATEEVLRTLLIAGAAALTLSAPISFCIAGLLIVISLSYRQTIHAYPAGGGAYRVSRENLGTPAALIAAAALLTDYVLTVAVSIAAGVAAVTSALPTWHWNRVELGLAFVALIAVGNLRGIRESGRIFAVPTYFFLTSMAALLAWGAYRYLTGDVVPLEPSAAILPGSIAPLTTFLVLRAFANGCTALTGIEALADGVPAFERPEAKNAAATLMTMAACGVTMFVGVTLLTRAYNILPSPNETVLSQLAHAVFGDSPLYYVVQGATVLILVLAANTAYSDFPRLASILAADRFLPRQFMTQGDRLAFSNGILVLSVLAGILLIAFKGDTHALIPLYMLGVFVSFTLSQTGMVLRWLRSRARGWVSGVAINGLGAFATSIVLVVVTLTKFAEGAWIIIVVIGIVVATFYAIHRHYSTVAEQLSLLDWTPALRHHHTVLVPIGGIHRAVIQAMEYARLLSKDVRAVYVDVDPETTEELRTQWNRWGQGVSLVVLPSPYRSLLQPLLDYIDQVHREREDDFLTVVLPEFMPARWWHHLLHNQRALLIKAALLFKPNVVVTDVPYHLRR